MKQFFATGVLSGAANCRLHFFSCLTLKQEAMDAIRSEASDLPITLTHVPESTLIDTLCALPIKDAFSTTACDRKWLHAGFSATHLPAVWKMMDLFRLFYPCRPWSLDFHDCAIPYELTLKGIGCPLTESPSELLELWWGRWWFDWVKVLASLS